MPKSGEFFIIDTRTCSEWQLDNHSYRKNNGNNRPRDIRNFLKINGQKLILSAIFRGDGKTTPEGFKKRIYKLLADKRFILIHYLNVDVGTANILMEKKKEKEEKKNKKMKKKKAKDEKSESSEEESDSGEDEDKKEDVKKEGKSAKPGSVKLEKEKSKVDEKDENKDDKETR